MLSLPDVLQTALQHHQAGRLPEAESLCRQILQAQPTHPDALHLLGVIAHQVGRNDIAIDLLGRAIAANPAAAEFHNHLAVVYHAQGCREEALAHFRQAMTLQPAFAEASYNLGLMLHKEGRLEEATTHYREALRLKPEYADAWNNLGNVLREQGRLEEAVAAYRQALTHQPTYAEAYYNWGNLLREQGKPEEAIAQYRQALAFKPAYAEAYYHLGLVLSEQGRLSEAVGQYERALSSNPDCTEAENQLMLNLQQLCDWRHLENHIKQHKKLICIPSSAIITPFSMLSIPSSPAEQLTCAKNYVSNYLSRFVLPREKLGFHSARVSKPKLRIGYLSADFCRHATASLFAELFELHDRNEFEVFAYSYGPNDGSSLRKRIARTCDGFVDITALSFVGAARHIHGDGVDILVDLQGYTTAARTVIIALRPAPIQVNYLGYPGTMGADFIDYIITDRFISPPGQEPFFSEKFVYLPDCYQINDRQREIAEQTPTRTETGLPAEGVVFCCFNNTYKITPAVFDIWIRLLKKVPSSVLWLLETNREAAANLRREASDRGADPDRLVFASKVPPEKHRARFRIADLFLDTFPYNAHTTASDALWAGLPVLTCAGETFASRVAGSLLTAIGLPELITTSLADYEALALRLARSPARLAGVRKRVQKNRLTAPLFDSPRFTRHIECAYQMMWEVYLKGEAPRRIDVPALPPSRKSAFRKHARKRA